MTFANLASAIFGRPSWDRSVCGPIQNGLRIQNDRRSGRSLVNSLRKITLRIVFTWLPRNDSNGCVSGSFRMGAQA